MNTISRRYFALLALALAACGQGGINSSREDLDASVRTAQNALYASVPNAREVAARAAGVLIMPSVTEGGLFVGGSYGEGALLIGDAPVEYFSVAAASFGLQAGFQKASHALFFMTPEALANFRTTDGWSAGAETKYVFQEDAASFGVSTDTVNLPVYAIVFGQSGILAGASIEGSKYSRIIR